MRPRSFNAADPPPLLVIFGTGQPKLISSISGLKTNSGSFSTRTTLLEISASNLTADSSSFSTRVTNLKTDSPIQMYAVTKKSTELIGYSYNFQYNIPVACLRFFTVYGPWGRPDMAIWKFTDSIMRKSSINVLILVMPRIFLME